MAEDLHQQMTPLLQRIAEALVEATPESWTDVAMRVEFTRYPDGHTAMSHSIWSDRHRGDPVEPTDEIYTATFELHQVCEQARQPWSSLEFRVEQHENGWKFHTNFGYDADSRAAPGAAGK